MFMIENRKDNCTKQNCNTMGGTLSRNRTYPYNCPPDEVARTGVGEYQMIDMKIFLRVTDAGRQRKHHHSDFQRQGHRKVAWGKQDNHEVEMERKEKKLCKYWIKLHSIFSSLDDPIDWSSTPVVSRWLWLGNRTFLKVASMMVDSGCLPSVSLVLDDQSSSLLYCYCPLISRHL